MLEFWTTPWRDHPPVIIRGEIFEPSLPLLLARRVDFEMVSHLTKPGDERSETRKKEEGKEGREEGGKGGKRKKGRNESRAEKKAKD